MGTSTIAYVPAPKTKTLGSGFPETQRARPKTAKQNGGGLRARWKDASGTIYEWDYQHGNIEVYDKRGRHLGDRRYPSGEKVGDAIDTRSVEP